MNESRKCIYDVISYTFNNEKIIKEALTPPFPQKKPSGDKMIEFKRLKWLGDSILHMVTTDMLYKHFPEEDEGYLTAKKNILVSANTITEISKLINVNEFMFRDPYGFLDNSDRCFSDTVEAIIGAIYLDSNIESVTKFVHKFWFGFINVDTSQLYYSNNHPKSILGNWTDKHKIPGPKYDVIDTSGPQHNLVYKVKVSIEGIGEAIGEAYTKKEAETEAAKELCKMMPELEVTPNPEDDTSDYCAPSLN